MSLRAYETHLLHFEQLLKSQGNYPYSFTFDPLRYEMAFVTLLKKVGFDYVVSENLKKLDQLEKEGTHKIEMTLDITMDEIKSCYEDNVYGKALMDNLEALVAVMRFSQVLGSCAVDKQTFEAVFQQAINNLFFLASPCVSKGNGSVVNQMPWSRVFVFEEITNPLKLNSILWLHLC